LGQDFRFFPDDVAAASSRADFFTSSAIEQTRRKRTEAAQVADTGTASGGLLVEEPWTGGEHQQPGLAHASE